VGLKRGRTDEGEPRDYSGLPLEYHRIGSAAPPSLASLGEVQEMGRKRSGGFGGEDVAGDAGSGGKSPFLGGKDRSPSGAAADRGHDGDGDGDGGGGEGGSIPPFLPFHLNTLEGVTGEPNNQTLHVKVRAPCPAPPPCPALLLVWDSSADIWASFLLS